MKLRSLTIGMTLLTAGTVIGVSTQHFASAAVSSGNRPILIQIEPCRLTDTRPAPNTVGPRSAPLGAGDTHTISAQQAGVPCSTKIPADATGLALNVTAIGATKQSFLTIWAGGTRPQASSLNPAPGEPPTPNAVTVELSVDQAFNIYNDTGSVNLVVDVNGYYVDHNHADTAPRIGSAMGLTPVVTSTTSEVVRLAGTAGSGPVSVPTDAQVVLNAAVTIGNSAGSGQFSVVKCSLQVAANGGSFASVGPEFSAESIGNNNHDQTATIALTAATIAPAGNFDARVVCVDSFSSAASQPRVRASALTVIATPS